MKRHLSFAAIARVLFWVLFLTLAVSVLVQLMTAGFGMHSHYETHRHNNCAMNRDQIDSAKRLWCIENQRSKKDTPGRDQIKVYLKDNKFLVCPLGGTYSINAVDQKCTCSAHPETTQ